MLLMMQHCAHARNRPRTAADEKTTSLLCFVCDFSGWYSFGNIIETVATRCHILKLRCNKLDFGLGLPQAPVEELTAPKPSS